MGQHNKQRQWKSALALFAALPLGNITNAACYVEAIRAHGALGQPGRALDTFTALERSGLPLSLVSFSAAIRACATENHWPIALSLLQDARDLGLEPDTIVCNAALSARLTLLAIDEPDRRLHLGVAVRQADVRDTIRYNGRPGVSAADDFVDTGEFPAASTTHIGLEAHYAHGPWAVVAEYATARPDVANGPDPQFHGYYVLGSWVLTGEQRAYDRAKGTVKRIIPEGRWGAPELVARYAAVDLSSGGIDGGRYDRIEVGANWWATTRWKFGVLYGHVWLKRDGETGHTQSLLTRLQWIY